MNQKERILPLLNLRNNAIIHVYLGPRYIADIIMGIKVKLISNSDVFIETNLDNTIIILKSKADKIIFFVFDIKKPPFILLRNKRRNR